MVIRKTKKLNPFERKEYLKYKKQGCSPLHRCKINGFNIHVANTFDHELMKFKYAYEFMKEGDKILTECDSIATNERCDLVNLSTGERYEFETDVKRALRFKGRPINVVPIGWSFDDKKWSEK